MTRRRIAIAAALLAFALPARAGEAGGDKELKKLTAWLTGSFSSEAQSKIDPDYRDIRLEMAPIWTTRDDGPCLYVEQAVAAKRDAPYRQRVYHLGRRADGALESRVYTLPDPERFIGAWRAPGRLDAIGPGDLALRDGCAIVLRRGPHGTLEGSTEGKGCASELRGAVYATSEVALTKSVLRSWDRGFDADGKQVWGAEKGPYEFRRVVGR